MRKALLAIAFAILPAIGAAQSQLDRMETVSETMNEAMVVMMVKQMEANGANAEPLMAALPDLDWDDEMRAAGQCMLDKYRDRIGSDGVDEMLIAMETFAAEVEALQEAGATMDDMSEPEGILPEGMTQDESVEITQSCGMMALQLKRMSESGFSAAMMDAAQ